MNLVRSCHVAGCLLVKWTFNKQKIPLEEDNEIYIFLCTVFSAKAFRSK